MVGERGDPVEPVLLRAVEDVDLRDQLIALGDGADAEAVEGPGRVGGRINGRAAVAAEGLLAPIAAVRDLDVDLELAREQG